MARLRELRLAREAETFPREISAGRFPAENKPKRFRKDNPAPAHQKNAPWEKMRRG
jgi:hypothetical protein